jgi:GntR family transcriptional regulator, vanillate catabolism transcriptional regulator
MPKGGGTSLPEIENGGLRPEADSQIARTILRLREMLLAGEFEPGERISEAPLAARIGVSRTPIRLALERLAHEGLLEPYATGGFIVRKFTLDDVWNGIEVRGLLEGGAARLAAERLVNDNELQALRQCQAELDAVGEPTIETLPTYLQANDRFHEEVLRLAKNTTLNDVLERLLSVPLAARHGLVSLQTKFPEATEIFIIARDQHLQIIDAISKRQGARAESIAREHAQISRRALEIVLAHTGVLSSLPGGPLIRI